MKKDVVIAIGIGIIIGIVTAISAVQLPSILSKKQKGPKNEQILNTTPNLSQPTSSIFEITEPSDETISTSPNITIKGKSIPNNLIVVETRLKDTIIQSKQDGTFQAQVKLVEGVNTVAFTQYLESGESEHASIHIFYTSEQL